MKEFIDNLRKSVRELLAPTSRVPLTPEQIQAKLDALDVSCATGLRDYENLESRVGELEKKAEHLQEQIDTPNWRDRAR